MRYKYPNNKKIFILDRIGINGNAYFKCGHWCTDNVFTDLINLKTGLAGWENWTDLQRRHMG